MMPPISGTNLTKLMTPFSPNLVTSLNPTFWLIFVRTDPGTFFNKEVPIFTDLNFTLLKDV